MQADLPLPDDDARAHSERLEAFIRNEIAAEGGSIPFSRFMECSLYAPGLGYYSAGSTKFGEAGDFTTAPELGPLFASCVAQAVAPVLQQLGPEAGFVEIGGGSGAFAEIMLKRLLELDALPTRYASSPAPICANASANGWGAGSSRPCSNWSSGWMRHRTRPGMGCCSPTK